MSKVTHSKMVRVTDLHLIKINNVQVCSGFLYITYKQILDIKCVLRSDASYSQDYIIWIQKHEDKKEVIKLQTHLVKN